MTPFVDAHVSSLIEDLRLLESLVTAPLGLHADIRMLRQSVPLPEAADLAQEENQKRRIAYRKLAKDPAPIALQAIDHAGSALGLLEAAGAFDAWRRLSAEWMDRAGGVLLRAHERVAGDLRAKTAARVRGLYVIVDPEATAGRPVAQVAEAALKGGARIAQLRDKTHDRRDILDTANAVKALCDEHDALFIMNDDPAIARSSGAHGLHLGQTDMPATDARRLLEPGQIIGLSNNDMDEVAASQSQGADYLAVGAIFGTATMGKSDRPTVGVDMVRRVKESASQPVVAIGGINHANVDQVVRAGADSVCVVSAVTLADDPQAAAGILTEAIQAATSQSGPNP